MPLDGQMREKLFDFGRTHFAWMPLAMKQDIPARRQIDEHVRPFLHSRGMQMQNRLGRDDRASRHARPHHDAVTDAARWNVLVLFALIEHAE